MALADLQEDAASSGLPPKKSVQSMSYALASNDREAKNEEERGAALPFPNISDQDIENDRKYNPESGTMNAEAGHTTYFDLKRKGAGHFFPKEK